MELEILSLPVIQIEKECTYAFFFPIFFTFYIEHLNEQRLHLRYIFFLLHFLSQTSKKSHETSIIQIIIQKKKGKRERLWFLHFIFLHSLFSTNLMNENWTGF